MEKKTRVFANYNQFSSRYREDTWEKCVIVENEKDVFDFMKSCHLEDARHRNNYPITSHWNRWVRFTAEEYVVIDGQEYFSNKREPISTPDYYETAKEKYGVWEKRLKTVIESKRLFEETRRKELKDRLEFERLKLIYNN